MKKLCLLLFAVWLCKPVSTQPLKATAADPLFTTYAAPVQRSSYKTDQGYRLKWNDPESGVGFISKQGPNLGFGIAEGKEIKLRLGHFYKEPVVTESYSDLVKLFYYPFRDVKVEMFFDVWSSQVAFLDIKVTNEGEFMKEITLLPYLYYPSGDSVNDILHQLRIFRFPLFKARDGWMKEHNIPVEENLEGSFYSSQNFDSTTTFVSSKTRPNSFVDLILQSAHHQIRMGFIKGISGSKTIRMGPGESTSFRIICKIDQNGQKLFPEEIRKILNVDPELLIAEDEKVYKNIPSLKTNSRDLQLFYKSCFSLMRQCMMPAEGECKTNYYVFSREPRWGWGYGGQVFHESLAMLAYAYMDPQGAMNSQRVYMQRQHPDGYINYRTGPYLNEEIPYDSSLTTSAPWFSYENLEIFKITKDKKFLQEAYDSGKKFYRYYVASRDSNINGLCEWGAEASLESVRDARVAVWDQVGWPSNFEGPDLNSMLVMEAKSLAEMADLLGFSQEAAKWKQAAINRADKINWFMWDETTGFYYNISRNNQTFNYKDQDDLKIKEIIGFLPYWAGISEDHQSEMLMKSLKDPEEFWRPFGIPTLSAQEKYYEPIGYWNGPVWVQWNYLIFRGMLDHGDKEGAKTLADKVIDNMLWHLKKDHTFWEFYSPDDRQAGWNQTYIWAGIAARFLIDQMQTK